LKDPQGIGESRDHPVAAHRGSSARQEIDRGFELTGLEEGPCPSNDDSVAAALEVEAGVVELLRELGGFHVRSILVAEHAQLKKNLVTLSP
jgi:hypothetical protein